MNEDLINAIVEATEHNAADVAALLNQSNDEQE